MSNNTIEKIKQAQSSLKSLRIPVTHVQEAMIQTKEISSFVKTALNKENRWIFQPGEQESIVSMLNEINQTNKEFYEKCRTPEHFNREIGVFLKMKNEILRKVNCIHFSLDQGFYGTEPLGFSPKTAVEISSKKIKLIRDGLINGKWFLAPIETIASENEKKEAKEKISASISIAETIFKNQNFNSFESPLTIEEIQIIYKYFQLVKSILDLEKQAIVNAIKKKSNHKTFSQDEILKKLSELEKNIENVKMPTASILPSWSIDLYKISNTDLNLRLHLLRIPFESTVFRRKTLKNLQKQKEIAGTEKSITDLHNNAVQELEQIKLFIEIFEEIDEVFSEVTGILQNLSISFGKIYHNASSQTITPEFLEKVFCLIKGMLEKGGEVAKSKTKKLDELQIKLENVDLFDPPIIKGILYSIDLLKEGESEIKKYCEQINSFLNNLSNDSSLGSMRTYKLLQNAYEESTNLTSAAMIFGSVTKTSILLKDSISNVGSILKNLTDLNESNNDFEILYKQTLSILEKEKDLSKENLIKNQQKVEELNWLIEDMLDLNMTEELRFRKELHKELEPIFKRINLKKLRESNQKSKKQIEEKKAAYKKPSKSSSHKNTKNLSKSDQHSKTRKKSLYDPFEPFEMDAIKDACINMTSSEGKMIYQVLTNTHTFFTLLNKMENTFKPGEGIENELIQDIEKSKTTHEFLNNFARLKFLPHGYYSNNNSPFNYNKEKKRFEIPAGIEKQLKLSETSTSPPMEVYRRLIRVLLGFDEPKTLSTIMPQQVLSIFEEDFMLKLKDRRVVEEKLQST